MRLFISYSSKNRQRVASLAQTLGRLGYQIWFDQQLNGGDVWWAEILKNIRACDAVLFIVSPESMSSYPCKLEFTYASQLGKPILPVLFTDLKDVTLPPPLDTYSPVSYSPKGKTTSQALVVALEDLPSAPPLPDPLPIAPDVPLTPLAQLRLRLATPEMSPDEQRKVVFELRMLLQGNTEQDARYLLEQMKQRPDLLAAVYREINENLPLSLGTVRPLLKQDAPPHLQIALALALLLAFATASGVVFAFIRLNVRGQGHIFGYGLMIGLGILAAKELPFALRQFRPSWSDGLRLLVAVAVSVILIFQSVSELLYFPFYGGDALLIIVGMLCFCSGFVLGAKLPARYNKPLFNVALAALGIFAAYVIFLSFAGFRQPLLNNYDGSFIRENTILFAAIISLIMAGLAFIPDILILKRWH